VAVGAACVRIGAGPSAEMKLPSVLPANRTLPLPTGTITRCGTRPCPIQYRGTAILVRDTSCAAARQRGRPVRLPVTSPAPITATLPASSAPAIVFFMAASFHFSDPKGSRDRFMDS